MGSSPLQAAATAAAEAGAHWLTRDRVLGYARIFVAIYLIAAIGWVALSADMVDTKGKPLGYDFITFWAASLLALGGEAVASFDMARIAAVEHMAVPASEDIFLWHYPPTFHLVVLPLALLPYVASYAAWTLGTFAANAAVVRRFAPRAETLWVFAAFPGVFINGFHGQNGFLTATLFGAALLQLEKRPLAAGVFFGLLSCKPQLGLLVPIALLCGGQWKAMFAAAATTLAFAGLSVAAFGIETWAAFWGNAPLVQLLLDAGTLPWAKIPSLYIALRMLGVPVLPAYLLHGVLVLAVVVALVLVWRSAAPLRLKGAVLVAGAVLVPPYLFDYDLVLLAIPIAILAWHGLERGWHTYEREILVAAWLTPMVAPSLAEFAGAPVAVLILVALFAVAMRNALAENAAARN